MILTRQNVNVAGFLTFNLTIEDDDSLWLSLTGPEGTKEFIRDELDL